MAESEEAPRVDEPVARDAVAGDEAVSSVPELAGRVRALVTALLGRSGDELRDDAHLVHDLGAQPSDLRDVARAVEEEFGIDALGDRFCEGLTVGDAIREVALRLAARPAEPPERGRQVPIVAVVERDDTLRRLLVRALTAGGYTAWGARSSDELLGFAEVSPPAVVLVDAGRPVVGTAAALHLMRRGSDEPGVVLVPQPHGAWRDVVQGSLAAVEDMLGSIARARQASG